MFEKLKERALEIRKEVLKRANSAVRVGSLFYDTIDEFEKVAADKADDKVGMIIAGSGTDRSTPLQNNPTIWGMIQKVWDRLFATNNAVNTAQTTANSAVTSAANAQTKANSAGTAASNAQKTANSAVTSAANAQRTADDATVAATNAQQTADDAKTAAGTAQQTADGAGTAAANAQQTADEAKTAAGTAQRTADDATVAAANAQETANQANNISQGLEFSLTFDNYAQIIAWLNGSYPREDGKTPETTINGTSLISRNVDESDYWFDKEASGNDRIKESKTGKIDLSDYLQKAGDSKDVKVTFSPATERTNITTGETHATLFGKIAKWFSGLGSAAFQNVGSGENDVAPGNHTHSNFTPEQFAELRNELSKDSELVQYGTWLPLFHSNPDFLSFEAVPNSGRWYKIGNRVYCSVILTNDKLSNVMFPNLITGGLPFEPAARQRISPFPLMSKLFRSDPDSVVMATTIQVFGEEFNEFYVELDGSISSNCADYSIVSKVISLYGNVIENIQQGTAVTGIIVLPEGLCMGKSGTVEWSFNYEIKQ